MDFKKHLDWLNETLEDEKAYMKYVDKFVVELYGHYKGLLARGGWLAKVLSLIHIYLPTSLAVAALLLLVPKPQRILDAGFQLSFSAVIGLAVMIPVLQDGWEEAAPSLRVANRVTDGVAGWNICLLYTSSGL